MRHKPAHIRARRTRRKLWLGLTAALALGGALPGSALAAVTIGSNLTANVNNLRSDGTVSQRELLASHQAPGGLTSSINGVVVRFAVKTGGDAGLIQLRVIRPGANAASATGAGTSVQVLPAETGVTSFAVNPGLPIKGGDGIGLNGIQTLHFSESDIGQINVWNPSLLDFGPSRSPIIARNEELLLQATIEPDRDNDQLGDETQDPTVPPAGPAPCSLVNLNVLGVRIGHLLCL